MPASEATPSQPRSVSARIRAAVVVSVVAALAVAVLILTAKGQIYDTNFYSLWEATALLAGDHPYRDFFEWGVPLQAATSALVQVLSGHRLLGEFLLQWGCIVAGVVVAARIALRWSHSALAALVTMLLAVPLLAETATFHYPKLLFYPVAVALCWRYIERPDLRVAGLLGLTTGVAFLFRHDHGVYLGGAAVLAFIAARLAHPAARDFRSSVRHAVRYTLVAGIVVAPWVLLVQSGEGLPRYVQMRAALYDEWSARRSPYGERLTLNPFVTLAPERPPARAGEVSFTWDSNLEMAERVRLAASHRLRLIKGAGVEQRDARWYYEAANVNDPDLLELRPYIGNTDGIDWELLDRVRLRVPTRENALAWIEQITLIIPLLLIATGCWSALRSLRRREAVPSEACRLMFAGVFLAVIDSRLFRESSYVVTVAPLTAALAARLLAGAPPAPGIARSPAQRAGLVARLAVGLLLVAFTAVSVFAFTRRSSIFEPLTLVADVRSAFQRLWASPPVNGTMARAAALAVGVSQFDEEEFDRGAVLVRYMHDCSAAGDRILVTGSTPYDVGYLVDRPIAGGHVFWHHGWRADPEAEAQLLQMIQQQSVPFAYSSHDPVLTDFERYPNIHRYLLEHYVAVDGSRGKLLVDTRRQATGRFGQLDLPCFR